MSFQVTGYSERGVLNSLLYEMAYANEPIVLLRQLLSLATFPFLNGHLLSPTAAKVLIEQSFSEFGTADVVMFLTSDSQCQSVFFEAKRSSIIKEFATFKALIRSKDIWRKHKSNLFVQLYHKLRLVGGLRTGGLMTLQAGVDYPDSSPQPIRKIGSNSVVLRATGLLDEHKGATYFIAIVPDEPAKLASFFETQLKGFVPAGLPEWDVTGFGYLSWSIIKRFCQDNKLKNSEQTFEFNSGQV